MKITMQVHLMLRVEEHQRTRVVFFLRELTTQVSQHGHTHTHTRCQDV